VETLRSARASEPTFWLAGHSGVLRCSRFRLKDRLRWMSRLACHPFNCGTSPEDCRQAFAAWEQPQAFTEEHRVSALKVRRSHSTVLSSPAGKADIERAGRYVG